MNIEAMMSINRHLTFGPHKDADELVPGDIHIHTPINV